MVDDLEGGTPEVEVVEPTPEEVVEPTPPKEKPTVRTYATEEEFRKELDKALGKSLSSVNKQMAILKAERDAIQAEKTDIEESYKSLEEKQFAEDPEALAGFRKTRTLETREKKLALKEAELDGLRWAITMDAKAKELQTKYQVSREVLETCSSEEQMETIAKAFPEVVNQDEPKSGQKKPKFDSNLSSGSPVDLGKMSARQLIQLGLDQEKK